MSLFILLLVGVITPLGHAFHWPSSPIILFQPQKQSELIHQIRSCAAEGLLLPTTQQRLFIPRWFKTSPTAVTVQSSLVEAQVTTNRSITDSPDFVRLVENACNPGAIFADKTHVIPYLEDQFSKVKMLTLYRPSGLGKSSLLSMLECYYSDRHKDKYSEMFGNLTINSIPPEKLHFKPNSFKVIRLNLTFDYKLSTNECDQLIRKQLMEHIQNNQTQVTLSAVDALHHILEGYASQGDNVMVLMDDMDYLFDSYLINAFTQVAVTVKDEETNASMYLKSVYNVLNDVLSKHSSIYALGTAATPRSLPFPSHDLTYAPEVWDIGGFTKKDFERGIHSVIPSQPLCDNEQILQQFMNTITDACSKYRFPQHISAEASGNSRLTSVHENVYNTHEILYILNKLQTISFNDTSTSSNRIDPRLVKQYLLDYNYNNHVLEIMHNQFQISMLDFLYKVDSEEGYPISWDKIPNIQTIKDLEFKYDNDCALQNQLAYLIYHGFLTPTTVGSTMEGRPIIKLQFTSDIHKSKFMKAPSNLNGWNNLIYRFLLYAPGSSLARTTITDGGDEDDEDYYYSRRGDTKGEKSLFRLIEAFQSYIDHVSPSVLNAIYNNITRFGTFLRHFPYRPNKNKDIHWDVKVLSSHALWIEFKKWDTLSNTWQTFETHTYYFHNIPLTDLEVLVPNHDDKRMFTNSDPYCVYHLLTKKELLQLPFKQEKVHKYITNDTTNRLLPKRCIQDVVGMKRLPYGDNSSVIHRDYVVLKISDRQIVEDITDLNTTS